MGRWVLQRPYKNEEAGAASGDYGGGSVFTKEPSAERAIRVAFRGRGKSIVTSALRCTLAGGSHRVRVVLPDVYFLRVSPRRRVSFLPLQFFYHLSYHCRCRQSLSLSLSPQATESRSWFFIFPFRVVDNSPSSLHLSLITMRICIVPASINHSTSSSLHRYRHRLSLPLTSSWFIPIFLFSSSLIVSTLCRHVRSFFLDMEFHWVIFFLYSSVSLSSPDT